MRAHSAGDGRFESHASRKALSRPVVAALGEHWKLEIYKVPWLSNFSSNFQRILHRPDRGYLPAGCAPRHRERTPSGSAVCSAHGERGRLHSLLPWQGSGESVCNTRSGQMGLR